jgi:co-chaperonin GroES (HSP10)
MVEPLGNRVAVRVGPPETVTESGLIIPDNAKQTGPDTATIIAVSEAAETQNGKIAVGVKVIFTRAQASKPDGDGRVCIVDVEDLLAIGD